MEARGPEQARFDQQMFEKELRTLHEVIERGGRKPPQDLSYTSFVLAVLWLVVGVPFFTGAVTSENSIHNSPLNHRYRSSRSVAASVAR